MKKKQKKQKKQRRQVPISKLTILTTANNIILNISDLIGNTLYWISAGTVGFKNSQKKTIFAAQKAIQEVIEKAKEFSIRNFEVKLKGTGTAKEVLVRTLKSKVFGLRNIDNQLAFPHNGCRPPKRRRL